MTITTNLRKIGTSFHLLIPKSIVDVFRLEDFIPSHEYEAHVYKNGQTLSFRRVKKQTAQDLINEIDTEKKDED